MRTYEILDQNNFVIALQEMADNLAPIILFRQAARVKAVNGLLVSPAQNSSVVGAIPLDGAVSNQQQTASVPLNALSSLPGGVQDGDLTLIYRVGAGLFVNSMNAAPAPTITNHLALRSAATLAMRNGNYLAHR